MSSTLKALIKLADKAGFSLPAAHASFPERVTEVWQPDGLEKLVLLRLNLVNLGQIYLAALAGHQQLRIWYTMM